MGRGSPFVVPQRSNNEVAYELARLWKVQHPEASEEAVAVATKWAEEAAALQETA